MIIQVTADFNHGFCIDVGRQFSHGTPSRSDGAEALSSSKRPQCRYSVRATWGLYALLRNSRVRR
ncbi:hypothetical protein BQ8794_100038 [Mesorhizobium prunaredense]|uniref:Uncharacterized protein n=1 Tax=Mesorhizobium prunaredense TaxID=1631249 RepID=A0A1R3UZX9_9HYPH|nr:hypothetical protein BQ8794_100038 [Mesorhizobium prunaredense]